MSGARLEIGSGYSPTPGFIHVDINPNAPGVDIVAPFYPLPMFADGSVSEIRAVDVVEHESFRNTAAMLAEFARVLEPGGKIYVQVPDAETIMRWFVEEPKRLINRCPPELPQTALAGAAWRLLGGHSDGAYAKAGDDWKWNCHGAMFSRESLTDALYAAGFVVESLEVNEHPNICLWGRRC